MAKKLRQIIAEASKDFSTASNEKEAGFIAKHMVGTFKHPVLPDEVFTGAKVKKDSTKEKIPNTAHYHEGEDEAVYERALSDAEKKRKEEVVKGLKKAAADFEDRYGKEAQSVMHGLATNVAKSEQKAAGSLPEETIKQVREELNKQNRDLFDHMLEYQPEVAEEFCQLVIDESMSVTLKPHGNDGTKFKVHSVGKKMAAHGGMKAGETIHDRHIDDLKDSGIKVYHRK